MALIHVPHMPEPIVDQPMPLVFYRRLNSTASIVATDYDMLHLKDFDGVLQHREAVNVGMDDKI